MVRTIISIAAVLVLVGLAAFQPGPVREAEAQAPCEFTLGFKALHDLMLATYGVDMVGACLENEWHNPENGDGLQRTTGGMMVWRKFDNWTAFTNGYMTWINGPMGLQARLNTERFPWEPVAAPVPAPSGGGAGAGGAGGGASDPAAAAPTATPVPSDALPTISLDISDDRVNQGEEFTVRLEASDDKGVAAIWWWAEDTDDEDLKDTHTYDCAGATPCRRSWTVSTNDDGRLTIKARVRDTAGQQSAVVSKEVRVREATATPTPTKTP